MNIKTIFDPIDRLIVQAKGYIQEQDVKKKYVKQIEEKTQIIQPELENRKNELLDLIDKIESDEQLKTKLEQSLKKVESYLENIELIAEKELAMDIIPQENIEAKSGQKKNREDYVLHQLNRIQEQLKVTNNFFEVADFANEIWADFDLFEEFDKDDTVVQLLVDRMNETNTKNTETRIGKDLKKTLEHIRMNLVKSTCWSDEEVDSYQRERDLKINQLKPVNIPNDRNYHVLMFGGVPEILKEINAGFALPSQLKIEWMDLDDQDYLDMQIKSGKKDLAVFFTMYPNHQKFAEIKKTLAEEAVPYTNVITFSPAKLVKTLEEELIKVSFQEHFASK